jgi:hypothetical protein
LIQEQLIASPVATVTFSSIPQTYKHLQLRWTAKSSGASGSIFLTLNGATSGYAWHYLQGNGSAVSSNNGVSATYIGMNSGINPSTTANCFSGGIADILNYASTSVNKTLRAMTGFYDAGLTPLTSVNSGFLVSTSAVTSITFAIGGAQNFAAGSRISLYGSNG